MRRPLYARMLRLRYLAPSGFLCFVFLEGAVALGFLLALAELVSWWGVVVLPVAVAAMVKLNDAVTGVLIRPAREAWPSGGISAAPSVPVQRPRGARQPVVQEFAGHPAASGHGIEGFGVERLEVRHPSGWEARADSPWAGPSRGSAEDPLGPARTAEPRRPDGRSAPAVAEVEVTAFNGSPSTRQWMDQIDTGQRLRQSANRRYE
jgi:hypothetical protein